MIITLHVSVRFEIRRHEPAYPSPSSFVALYLMAHLISPFSSSRLLLSAKFLSFLSTSSISLRSSSCNSSLGAWQIPPSSFLSETRYLQFHLLVSSLHLLIHPFHFPYSFLAFLYFVEHRPILLGLSFFVAPSSSFVPHVVHLFLPSI